MQAKGCETAYLVKKIVSASIFSKILHYKCC